MDHRGVDLPNTKRCPQCQQTLPHAAFRLLKGINPGLDPWCKDCRRAYNKRWWLANYSAAARRGTP